MIRIKYVFEAAAPEDGRRFLVDRFWPRGVSKATLKADTWHREVAPIDALRRWFRHLTEKWPEFRKELGSRLDIDGPSNWLLAFCWGVLMGAKGPDIRING